LSNADLYISKIDFSRYLNRNDCSQCGFLSCDAFILALKKGEAGPRECSFISRNNTYAFEAVGKIEESWPEVPLLTHPRPAFTEAVRKIEESWPEVPLLTHPRPAFTGLVELNHPDERSLMLISGNNEYTEQVLLTVLGTTVCPFYVLFVDTDGNTVDMAMIYKTLTAERIRDALKSNAPEEKVAAREILLPGLASSIKSETETLTGWKVGLGPVCAAELPLFLADIWIPL